MPQTNKKKYPFPVFALFVFLSVFTAGDFYISDQLAWFFGTKSTIPFNVGFAFLILLIFYIQRFVVSKTTKFSSIIYSVSTILFGSLFFVILSIAIVDFFSLFVDTKPIIYGFSSLSLTLIISVYSFWNAANIRVTNYDINSEKVTKEIKIVQLSDIHIGHLRGKNFLDRIIKKTLTLNPDYVVITGDLYDGEKHVSLDFLKPLEQIKVPIMFIEGNHDLLAGITELKQILRELGIIVLDNEIYETEEVEFIGLKYMKADKQSFDVLANETKNTIQSVLAEMNISENKYIVMLHHSPSGVKYAMNKKIDLYLSGHTHAGQVFPMTIFNKLVFKHNRGFHNFEGTRLVISEGIGSSRPPMRLGTKSEIVAINIKPQN